MADKPAAPRPGTVQPRQAEDAESRKRQPPHDSNPGELPESARPAPGQEPPRVGPADPPDRP
jgi:hypothetical protein